MTQERDCLSLYLFIERFVFIDHEATENVASCFTLKVADGADRIPRRPLNGLEFFNERCHLAVVTLRCVDLKREARERSGDRVLPAGLRAERRERLPL